MKEHFVFLYPVLNTAPTASLIQPRMDHLCLHDMNSRNGTMIHAWWQIIDLKTHLVI